MNILGNAIQLMNCMKNAKDLLKNIHLQIVKIIKKKIFSKFNKRDRQNKNKKKTFEKMEIVIQKI